MYGITPPSPTCMVKHYTYNLSSFWRRANSRNPAWLSLYGGNFTLALINLFLYRIQEMKTVWHKNLKNLFMFPSRYIFLAPKVLQSFQCDLRPLLVLSQNRRSPFCWKQMEGCCNSFGWKFFCCCCRFIPLAFIYCITGTLYNKYNKGIGSFPEMIPNHSFWIGLPSLMKVSLSNHILCL